MGGTDLLDRMVMQYPIQLRIKKWWFGFYGWSLSTSAVNGRRFKIAYSCAREPYLKFLHEFVVKMFRIHGTKTKIERQMAQIDCKDAMRYDGLNHMPGYTHYNDDESQPKQRRNCTFCAKNGKKNNKTVQRLIHFITSFLPFLSLLHKKK